MKILKYLTVVAAVVFFASCEKHTLSQEGEEWIDQNTTAELRIHYVEPLTSGAATRFDSLYINGKLNANSTNAFGVYNVLPNANKFYAAPVGNCEMKLWRKAESYTYNFTASKGKQEIFIYDVNEEPVVLNTSFPYYSTAATGNAATWGADSTAYVEFYNFLYEEYGTNKVPYNGTLQLQYQDPDTKEWHNVGEPVSFGQAGGRSKVKIVKSAGVNSGYRTISLRMLTSNNEVMKYTNSSGKEIEFTTTNTTYNGRVYMIYARGIRTSKSITAGLTVKAIH